jgi:ferredoxin-type protein NapH
MARAGSTKSKTRRGTGSAGKLNGRKRGAANLSLPVLCDSTDKNAARLTIRPSRNSRRRAIVLIAIHVLIAAHIVQWLVTGMTISPVEPSESMETLREGSINAGFVFFTLALLSTVLFGRFFCGWACHVVALQDLCSTLLKRIGIRPKPWRTRLLIFMPLLLALYMFVWPVFHRAALTPAWSWASSALGWPEMPLWMGRSAPLHGFSTGFIVSDFWATFPPWYIAIPFLLLCGFGCVYFLGAKGFCTYGCPYGGFFAPVDRVSVGRIVVNDDCHQCGHCTAVCSSNVRVHEEVRDYGMVVDPGCMKCMDCVSVCPNDALSFSFAKPAALAKPVSDEAKSRSKAPRQYDLSWPEEITFGLLFVLLTFSFRGMLNAVPLLMAAGLGAIATFLAWQAWRVLRDKNVRMRTFQLRLRGKLKAPGLAVILIGVSVIFAGAWSAVVRFSLWRAGQIDASLAVSADEVFSAGYEPAEDVRERAERAVALFEWAGPITSGGIGWTRRQSEDVRMAWLLSVAGRFDEAESLLLSVSDRGQVDMDLVESLLLVMRARGASGREILETLDQIGRDNPELLQLQVLLAQSEARSGSTSKAFDRVRRVAREAGEWSKAS